MIDLITRLLQTGKGEETEAEPLKCYICGEETGYRCSVCNEYICNKHTEPGSTICVKCAAKRKTGVMR